MDKRFIQIVFLTPQKKLLKANDRLNVLLQPRLWHFAGLPSQATHGRAADTASPSSMSLHRLKESLHDCCTSSQPQSQPRSPPPAPLVPRRPPKTSLSQQLLRLEASSSDFSSLAAPPPPAPKPPAQKPREDAAGEPPSDEEGAHALCRHRPAPAPAIESRGPYEPLVLSPPGERPVVQVPSGFASPRFLFRAQFFTPAVVWSAGISNVGRK